MFAGLVNKRSDTAKERFTDLENRPKEMISTKKVEE